ncbi:hypothetical protein FQR65_LT04279 [Abscondita terminalis]|nr:hypothetical protein FQR65_LT04279 [Abscondita terminalis]
MDPQPSFNNSLEILADNQDEVESDTASEHSDHNASTEESDNDDENDTVSRFDGLDYIGEMNLRKTSVEEEILVVNLLAEKVMGESLTLKNGVSVLVDVLNVSWRIMQWVTPHNINLIVKIIENYPVKELIIHVVNKSYLIQIAVNIIWPFLSDHRKELIKFHFNNWASLHEEVDPKVLPAEYGGTGPDLIFKENVLKDADILTEQIKQNMFKRNQLTH